MNQTKISLSDRDLERIVNQKTKNEELADILFLKFSSDTGVIINQGRRGALFAPNALLAVVKKLANHHLLKWSDIEMADKDEEKKDFHQSQKSLSLKIKEVIKKEIRAKKYLYLGGGHDYIYPILSALNSFAKKIVVINIDPHLDTRTDALPNSGTPFRQIANDFEGEIEIVQLGMNEFSNSISTMSNLSKGKEVVASYEDIRFGTKDFTKTDKFLSRLIPYQKDTLYFFSLDADAFNAGLMEGVSAVNHRGLSYDFIEDVLLYSIDQLKCEHFGFFEYNPVYDNLSQKGAKTIAALIYQVMDDRFFVDPS